MKKIIVLLLSVSLALCVQSQEKMLTMEEALVKNRSSMAPKNLSQLQFVYGTEDYVYLKNNEEIPVWMRGNMKSGTARPFLDLRNLNGHLKSAGADTLTEMPSIQFNQSPEWIFLLKGNKIALDPVSNRVRTLIERDQLQKDIIEASKAGYVAYVNNYNLFVSNGTESRQVTTDGSSDIVYAGPVHREEFGITKGTFWSNDGRHLAFYRMDQSMVTDYPIIDWTQTPAKANNIKYPMAGDKSHHVTVGVYHPETGRLVYLKTGEPADQYLTNIAWSPDNKWIYIAVLNREQDHMKLNQYDAVSGDFVKTLFEEKDDHYVEPLVPMLFVKNHPSQFIWQSRRDGWTHLYLYDTSGNLTRQLTSGKWEVLEVKGFDQTGNRLYYLSTEASPLTRDLYSLDMKSGKTRKITHEMAVHTTQLSSSGKYVLDNSSSPQHARLIRLLETSSGKSSILFDAPDPLDGYALGSMKIFTIQNQYGDSLFCRLYQPVNFDSTKRYPVITYWYGGPHAQMITAGYNGGASDYWFQYMAERGYVVFTLDTRGSDHRGKAFEQVIHRRSGEPQLEDMMAGTSFLKSLPYTDSTRMGLFGWSYGGYMTISFMLHHPGIFKAAVAGGPVTDWRYYEIMYGERYMDTPQENPEGYAAADLTRIVSQLKGKLLLIHGLQDNVVVQQHSVRFVRAAIDKNIQVDYMIYPGHEHNVLGKDRAHLYQKVTDYFNQNLGVN